MNKKFRSFRIVQGGVESGKVLEIAEDVLDTTGFKSRRARVNDEQAEADMGLDTTVEQPGDVPRATHLPLRARAPHSGEALLMVGLLIGSMIVIGVLLATWPVGGDLVRCSP